MHGNSRPVRSMQSAPHPALALRLQRNDGWAAPVDEQARAQFDRLADAAAGYDAIVFDHACGTGRSTTLLATRHPEALVVGIERSTSRLAKSGVGAGGWLRRGNVLLLRADCVPLWRLAAAAGLQAEAQYFLYPTPWPKARHLRRRWHAHPAFTDALALGGRIELRTNWRTYAAEFAHAVATLAPHYAVRTDTPTDAGPVSDFERKYRASGHRLYRVVAE